MTNANITFQFVRMKKNACIPNSSFLMERYVDFFLFSQSRTSEIFKKEKHYDSLFWFFPTITLLFRYSPSSIQRICFVVWLKQINNYKT